MFKRALALLSIVSVLATGVFAKSDVATDHGTKKKSVQKKKIAPKAHASKKEAPKKQLASAKKKPQKTKKSVKVA